MGKGAGGWGHLACCPLVDSKGVGGCGQLQFGGPSFLSSSVDLNYLNLVDWWAI